MFEPSSPAKSRIVSRWCAVCALIALFGTSACATGAQQAKNKETLDHMTAMTERIEEVERTNSRLTVRMEELEDQLFLLNDRVESHRLALQRRAYKPRTATAQLDAGAPQAPQPAPESYYYEGQGSANVYQPRAQRPVKRIQLNEPQLPEPAQPAAAETKTQPSKGASEEDYEHVVISEDEYREFFGEPKPSVASTSNAASSGTSSSGKRAQPSVTSERLSTTVKTDSPASSRSQEAPAGIAAAPKSTGLKLYKDSLSAYRAGNYDSALVGFQAFLKSKPKRDYVDNALYWIGECYYGLGQLDEAIAHFDRVLSEQPDGNKVPDAMLKMSLALEKKGEPDKAKRVLQDLIGQYPDTHAAGLGQKRLNP